MRRKDFLCEIVSSLFCRSWAMIDLDPFFLYPVRPRIRCISSLGVPRKKWQCAPVKFVPARPKHRVIKLPADGVVQRLDGFIWLGRFFFGLGNHQYRTVRYNNAVIDVCSVKSVIIAEHSSAVVILDRIRNFVSSNSWHLQDTFRSMRSDKFQINPLATLRSGIKHVSTNSHYKYEYE